VREGEPDGVVVQDHRDVARHGVEAVLQPQPQVLQRVEHAVRAGEVAVVVTGREAQGVGLDPGDGARLLAGPGALALQLELGLHSDRVQRLAGFLEARGGGDGRGERHG
jgi:hypothetical protein